MCLQGFHLLVPGTSVLLGATSIENDVQLRAPRLPFAGTIAIFLAAATACGWVQLFGGVPFDPRPVTAVHLVSRLLFPGCLAYPEDNTMEMQKIRNS